MKSHIPFPDIPPDRADGSSSWVHKTLIYTGKLGYIQPLTLTPVWLALVVLSARPWQALWLPAALVAGTFFFADWGMLAQLPRRQRSWGPVSPSLLGMTIMRGVFSLGIALIAPTPTLLYALAAVQAMISAAAIYATWIEPFAVKVTSLRYTHTDWKNANPLRVLHISDIHFEGASPRENAVLHYVRKLKPDLILLTGDYLNLSSVYAPQAQQGVRQFLKQLKAPLGIFAVTGSPVVDVPHLVPGIFQGLPIRWLNDEVVTLHPRGQALHLLGVRCTYDEDRDVAIVKQLVQGISEVGLKVLLYHTPDLMPALSSLDLDMYMCGHTHGGQIRLPIFGALVTSSRWGKRYEMGLYREGVTTLYVSRGLGVEGLGAPRARFLASPELVLWSFEEP